MYFFAGILTPLTSFCIPNKLDLRGGNLYKLIGITANILTKFMKDETFQI